METSQVMVLEEISSVYLTDWQNVRGVSESNYPPNAQAKYIVRVSINKATPQFKPLSQ